MSRGAHIKDQLLVEPGIRDQFMEAVASVYQQGRRLALETLERLINAATEQEEMKPLLALFKFAHEKAILALRNEDAGEMEALESKGYVRLRKIIITPTRRIFEAPELIMGNRVLRVDLENWPPDRFLRVSFRDENFKKINANMG